MKKKIEKADLNLVARKIIEGNQYVVLSTADKKGDPWISIVAYTYDKNWNIYFVSIPSSRHCKNIKERKNIAFSIYDSHQNWGEGVGIQAEAQVEIVPIKDFLKVSRIYSIRKYPFGKITQKIVSEFIRHAIKIKKLYKFYKIIPRDVWINDPYSKIDNRVEVNLNS